MKKILKLGGFFILLFGFSIAAYAVAPRISQDMFGQEINSDILAYDSTNSNDRHHTEVAVQIAKQAFAIEQITLSIDIVPSKQLAIYALFNGDVRALIGKKSDLTSLDQSDYFNSVFYIYDDGTTKIPIALYINKNAQDAEKMFSSFNETIKSTRLFCCYIASRPA